MKRLLEILLAALCSCGPVAAQVVVTGVPGPLTSSTSPESSFTMDASTDYWACRFMALSAAPIHKVEFYVTTKTQASTIGNLGVVITAHDPLTAIEPTVSAGTPTDIGGGSPTLVSIPSSSISTNARHTATFTNAFTPTAGTWYWVVFYPASGTFDADDKYTFRTGAALINNAASDELQSTSTDTGSTWSNVGGMPQISLLTTGDAYIPLLNSSCLDSITGVDWDEADPPDERGVAWDVASGETTSVTGMRWAHRIASSTADYTLSAYSDTTQVKTRSVDVSSLTTVTTTITDMPVRLPTATISGPATGRLIVRPTSGTETVRVGLADFGTEARREACESFRYVFYTTRDGGSGSFTDARDSAPTIYPTFDYTPASGGGSVIKMAGPGGGLVN